MDTSALLGQELSSVTFVQDYVQLDFNGPGLTLLIWPEVSSRDGTYRFPEPGYRDSLCSQIGKRVQAVSLAADEALSLQFESDVIFRVSLRSEDYVGPEAMHFISGVAGDPLIVI